MVSHIPLHLMFQSYLSQIQTGAVNRILGCNGLRFNPILVRYKRRAVKVEMDDGTQFQSYLSQIQTNSIEIGYLFFLDVSILS